MATAAEIMDGAAALQNDAAKSDYSYDNVLPYLNIAVGELQELMQQNNIPFTNEQSAALVVPIATTVITTLTTPAYPSDLITIQKLSERRSGSSDIFTLVERKTFLPSGAQAVNELAVWSWIDQEIRFIGALSAREIKLDYIKTLLPAISDSGTDIPIIGCKSLLMYRTAALLSRFVGENTTRADELDGFCQMAADRFLIIATKDKQFKAVRRRPFMSAYKNRSLI